MKKAIAIGIGIVIGATQHGNLYVHAQESIENSETQKEQESIEILEPSNVDVDLSEYEIVVLSDANEYEEEIVSDDGFGALECSWSNSWTEEVAIEKEQLESLQETIYEENLKDNLDKESTLRETQEQSQDEENIKADLDKESTLGEIQESSQANENVEKTPEEELSPQESFSTKASSKTENAGNHDCVKCDIKNEDSATGAGEEVLNEE